MLAGYLYACIIPERHKDEFVKSVHPGIIDKIHYLPQDGLWLLDWSEKVYNFVERMDG